MIVSPMMALYKWPRVINFGAGVEATVDVAVVADAAMFWHNPTVVGKEKTTQKLN